MHKLVARQQQARRDPQLAAKLKRAIAKGGEFDDISDSDSDSDDSDDEDIHIKGAVNTTDIHCFYYDVFLTFCISSLGRWASQFFRASICDEERVLRRYTHVITVEVN